MTERLPKEYRELISISFSISSIAKSLFYLQLPDLIKFYLLIIFRVDWQNRINVGNSINMEDLLMAGINPFLVTNLITTIYPEYFFTRDGKIRLIGVITVCKISSPRLRQVEAGPLGRRNDKAYQVIPSGYEES
jgi:uncharacterized membrane protein (DUF485 family)